MVGGGGGGGGAPRWSAARGHEKNAQYMADFDAAYRDMTGEEGTPGQDVLFGRAAVDGSRLVPFAPGWLAEPLGESIRNHGLAVRGALNACLCTCASVYVRVYARGLAPITTFFFIWPAGNEGGGWLRGPAEPPLVYDASDRPLMSVSVHLESGQAVVAGTDHACYCVSLETAERTRQLHTKTSGHADWVSCAAFLRDGRVIRCARTLLAVHLLSGIAYLPAGCARSGGADKKLCLWNKAGNRCYDLLGHTAAVSALAVGAGGSVAVSASYDTTVRGWSTSGRGAQLACLQGHTAPVLDLAWPAAGAGAGPLISGDRSAAPAASRVDQCIAITKGSLHPARGQWVN